MWFGHALIMKSVNCEWMDDLKKLLNKIWSWKLYRNDELMNGKDDHSIFDWGLNEKQGMGPILFFCNKIH